MTRWGVLLRVQFVLAAAGWVGVGGGVPGGRAQVFTVGEASATADIKTDFKPTHVELPPAPLTERGRRELVRNLEAEQGFAHRVLPLGAAVTLHANGNLQPGPEGYRRLIYEKGQSAAVGDRVVVTALAFKGDRLIVDLNGGPYPKHRILSHLSIGVGSAPVTPQSTETTATGCRIALVFEGGLPEISAPEVKALLDPLVDFGVKTTEQAYADTLPAPIRSAIASHEVLVGMDHRMVLASRGAPESKVRESTADGKYEEWIYGHPPKPVEFVRFVGDRVAMVKLAALGQPVVTRDKDEMAGYGEPTINRTVLVGNGPQQTEAEGPPTLREPGEIGVVGTADHGSNGKVQFPEDTKVPPPATSSSSSVGKPWSGTGR